jgi:hypothetical protein
MPRIETDPNLQICPDFASDAFAAIREVLIAASDSTHEETAASLTASWEAQNAINKAAWAMQEEGDALLREEQANLAREAQTALQAQLDKDAADELREAEKKKPKMHTFNATKSIGADVIQRPSPYALERLRKFEYIELWYFSSEGCNDAAQSQRSATKWRSPAHSSSATNASFTGLSLQRTPWPSSGTTSRTTRSARVPMVNASSWNTKPALVGNGTPPLKGRTRASTLASLTTTSSPK